MQSSKTAAITQAPLAPLRHRSWRMASPSTAAPVASVLLAVATASMSSSSSLSAPAAASLAETEASATAFRASALLHALSSTVISEPRSFGSAMISRQPTNVRSYAATATTASMQATTAPATPSAAANGSASSRPQPPRRHHVIDLGNGLTAEVPVTGFPPTPSSRHHRGIYRPHRRTRSNATVRHRHGRHQHASAGDGNMEASAANSAAHAPPKPELAQPPRPLKHLRHAASSSPLPQPQCDTQGRPEATSGGLQSIHHTAVEAVALLECATVLEALELSSPSHFPPCSAAATADKARANFEELQTRALPLLFHVAQAAATSLGTDAAKAAAAVTDAELATALQCLAAHLQYMAAATRADGRRHVSALPPAVVVALWEEVMPYVHRRFHDRDASKPPLHLKCADLDGCAREDMGEAGTSGLRGVEDATAELRDAAGAAAAAAPLSTAAPVTLAVCARSTKKSVCVPLRRALAVHTRQIALLLPPPALALVLTRMHQCGALADDVLGPIAADYLEALRRSGPGQATSGGDSIAALRQRVLRLPDGVGSDDGRNAAPSPTAFTSAAAVTMARLLGRAAIPGHQQLHWFFHLALLPELTRVLTRAAERAAQSNADKATGDAVEALPSLDALLDLTAALRHYAVSGHAVTHLTTLWMVYFVHRQRTDDTETALAECAALLRAVSTVPSACNRTQRRQARNIGAKDSHGGSNAAQQRRRLLKVAEGDYSLLVDEACAQVCRLCRRLQRPASSSSAAAVAPTQLLGLLRLLLRVSSPHWAEAYETLASAVLAALTHAAASLAASAPLRHKAEGLAHLLPLTDTRRTLHALLHRGSLIPDHPLHRVLLRRLLHSPAAMTDTAVASQVLLGLELMVPVEEGSTHTVEASTTTTTPAAAAASSGSNGAIATTTDIGASAKPTVSLVTAETLTAVDASTSAAAITPGDRHRALQVFRRLGRSITPTAFVAGLCVVALDTLPSTAQVAVVNHLTSIASAVSPAYLVKGMDAVVRQLPSSAIDDVSVQRWFSRFTARDVVRRVDPVGCAVLLDILSANLRYQRNCALAKECITRRIGVALRRTGEDGAGDGAVSLEALPRVVTALQRASVFMPKYYSRACRLLLGQVERASLGELLEPFAAVAEAYMSRQRSEAQASVFKDVWELVRGRVMEEAGRLSLPETISAINAFAALDVTDDALFGVLVYQLWVCLRTAEAEVVDAAATSRPSGASDAGSSAAAPEEPAMCSARRGPQPGESGGAADVAAATADDGDEVAEAQVLRRVQAAQDVLRTLTPSAVAVVTTTLFARGNARVSSGARTRAAAAVVGGVGNDGEEDGDFVRTLLPWMLVGLRGCHAELYPVDVVHLMPSLLEHYAAAAAVEDASAPADHTDRYAALLHAAYDACRSTFLLMYALLPDTVSAAEEPLLPAAEQHRIAEQRAQWTPATKLSVEVVPRPWFASLLVSLSSAALVDVAVALACVRRACTRRVCGELLPISQLVDVCLSLCWLATYASLSTATKSATVGGHSSGADAQTPATPDATRQDELSSRPPPSPQPTTGDVLRTAMATVLSALWIRSDELSSSQVSALLRCLRDTYGADKVDADFVERLEAQKARLLSQRQQQQQRSAAAAPHSTSEAETEMATEAANQSRGESPPDLVTAQDLFSST
ncbi:hypothetical protein JIQ42_08478 [Leishmania sp. Namibia]|uniref:hypothetical protein n=1 Tax=Leishmania sp. Namibia TaxID=2802991 RepID=UPI001B7344DE|nr:hypothetical protein JIQ42_08478 [Leishmania sp. Namibia]